MEWIVVIIAIVLLLFGAKKIPQFARSLGKASGEFKRGKQIVEMEMKEVERQDRADTRGSSIDNGPSRDLASDAEASPLRRAARDLGIITDGKSDDEVKVLIQEKVNPT
jgi:TatA/E family protein of Tat protein translocase